MKNENESLEKNKYAVLNVKTHDDVILTWCIKSMITIVAKFMTTFNTTAKIDLQDTETKI